MVFTALLHLRVDHPVQVGSGTFDVIIFVLPSPAFCGKYRTAVDIFEIVIEGNLYHPLVYSCSSRRRFLNAICRIHQNHADG